MALTGVYEARLNGVLVRTGCNTIMTAAKDLFLDTNFKFAYSDHLVFTEFDMGLISENSFDTISPSDAYHSGPGWFPWYPVDNTAQQWIVARSTTNELGNYDNPTVFTSTNRYNVQGFYIYGVGVFGTNVLWCAVDFGTPVNMTVGSELTIRYKVVLTND